MHFIKWQGCGNDFVLVDLIAENSGVTDDDLQKLAPQICNRRFGIGADGILLLKRNENKTADMDMRIFNADGSEAQMCGNGIRCLALHAYNSKFTEKSAFSVQTKAGIMKVNIKGSSAVEVDMGAPILTGEKIPVNGYDGKQVIDIPITVGKRTFFATCVSMGNPHCVIFADKNDFATDDAPETLGRFFEHHKMFPEGTNVEFAEVINDTQIRMRVWERGAGVTAACGTGACATLVAATITNRTKRQAKIILDGGSLEIDWHKDTQHVFMTGPAIKVFEGNCDLC